MQEFIHGLYGVYIYLPFSGLARRWQRFSRKLRRKSGGMLQQTNLESISWRKCTDHRLPRIWERGQANGNIRISELGIINLIAETCEDNSNIFEIGTFDGRTTINLAFSSLSNCRVFTLDLKPEMETVYALENGEKHIVEKGVSGERIERYQKSNASVATKIHQLYGDSAHFDFSPYYNSCSLVFVDGSHAYDYVCSDTKEAIKLVKKGGIIIWHDYGIWEGVTRALEEIRFQQKLNLKNIRGTSLVYLKITT